MEPSDMPALPSIVIKSSEVTAAGFRRRPSRRASPRLSLRLALLGLASLTGAPALGADAPAVSVELNKLEPQGPACRAYFVVENPSNASLEALKLDLIFFRTDGVIDRRLVLDLAPVRAGRKNVKNFDFDGLACDAVGSVLVNEVSECRDASGPVAECADRLKVSSRAGAPLTK